MNCLFIGSAAIMRYIHFFWLWKQTLANFTASQYNPSSRIITMKGKGIGLLLQQGSSIIFLYESLLV